MTAGGHQCAGKLILICGMLKRFQFLLDEEGGGCPGCSTTDPQPSTTSVQTNNTSPAPDLSDHLTNVTTQIHKQMLSQHSSKTSRASASRRWMLLQISIVFQECGRLLRWSCQRGSVPGEWRGLSTCFSPGLLEQVAGSVVLPTTTAAAGLELFT